MKKELITEVTIPGIPKRSGKVREIFEVQSDVEGIEFLLIVTTDRISAFDVIFPNGIPEKGRVLNQLSAFFKKLFEFIVPSDFISVEEQGWISYLGQISPNQIEELRGRTMLVAKAEVIPVECIVRGYITGSLWKEYLEADKRYSVPHDGVLGLDGIWLPVNLKECEKLPMPIFTPTIKAKEGHDEPLSYQELINYLDIWLRAHPKIKRQISGALLAQNLRSTSLALYLAAQEYARNRGIIIADTKFEFGFGPDRQLLLIDELLTPDSSRFWDIESYEPGRSQPSYDKQPIRDWLIASGWNKEPPAPELPEEVVLATTERYREAYKRLTGCLLD